jgi:uncharacterized protein YodC (DUF2158 family)
VSHVTHSRLAFGRALRLSAGEKQGHDTMAGSAGEFSKGDIVALKCGGCNMIIEETSGGHAICVWHDNDGAPQSARYEFALLEKINASAGKTASRS